MSTTTPIVPAAPPSSSESTRNPAVILCCRAAETARQQAKARNLSNSEANVAAREAYREALPDLSGYENIRDFVACVTHGMLDCFFLDSETPKLLYAAQVAMSALQRAPKDPKPAVPKA